MKKLLFILILLIPFVIKAESDFELAKMWDVELSNTYWESYYLNDKHIRIKYDEIVSVDALTGVTQNIDLNNYNNTYYAIYDNRILLIGSKKDNSSIDIILYNENLTQLNKETIEYFKIDHARMYNNKYIIISGETEENDEYTRYVYFIDSNGKIYKSDKKQTIHNTYKYYNENNNTYYYMDAYGNAYILNDYKIISNIQNSDGSYFINYEDKILKFNSNGTKIAEVTIPVGHSPSFIKKDNTYYVIANINTKPNNRFKYKVILYKMDSNLNLSEPTDPFPENDIQTDAFSPYVFTENYYKLFMINNHLYMKLEANFQNISYYEISDDLTITPVNITMPSYSSTDDFRYDDTIFADKNSIYEYNKQFEEYTEPFDLLFYTSDDENNSITKSYKTIKDKKGNTYITITSFQNENSKLELAKVNSQGELVFRKTVYDYTQINDKNYCWGYVDNDLNFFDNYIVVAANTTSQNIIKFYDYDGNEIYDLSQDVNNYPDLSYVGMKIYNRGIYFEYAARTNGCIGGVSAYTNNLPETKVLEAQDVVPRTYMVYYEIPFLVNTKVNGAGTVTAKQIRALTGSSVEFTVTPDPGYVLSVVKVIDSKGNILTFTNNTFVMPSSDVVIEATFVPINPNTQTFISYAILGVCVLAGLLTVFLSSKKKQYE